MRRPSLTRRAAIVGALIVTVAALIAPYLRVYLDQRAKINALREQVGATQSRVDDLKRQQARWQDPAYVASQARQRLRYVYPGETGYVVLDPAPKAVRPDPAHAAARAADKPGQPWFANLWGSVTLAGTDPLAPSRSSGTPTSHP